MSCGSAVAAVLRARDACARRDGMGSMGVMPHGEKLVVGEMRDWRLALATRARWVEHAMQLLGPALTSTVRETLVHAALVDTYADAMVPKRAFLRDPPVRRDAETLARIE